MSVDVIVCPHCHTRVVALADGTCPTCRQNARPAPVAVADEHPGVRAGNEAEGHYDESHPSTETAPVISLSLSKPTPGQRAADFHQTLAALTPFVIVTPTILIANVLIFGVMVASGVDFFRPTALSVLEWGANFGPKTMNGQWWRLGSCMFLHFGIIHLGFNMWVLSGFGVLVERLVGNFGFALLYVVSGIAGGIASLAWHPLVISAGASGAIFGIAGALLGVIAFRRDTVPAEVLKQLRSSMGGFLVYNLVFGMAISGIDMAAHIGGLAAGFLCGLLVSQPLSVEMVGRRPLRNAAVVFAGAVTLPLAVWALPAPPLDVDREMQEFADTEKRVLDSYNRLVVQSQRGILQDADCAATIEREILPPWIEARGRVERLLDTSYVDRLAVSRLVQYMKCREESWRLQAEGVREQDVSKIERSKERWEAAEKLVKEMNQ